MDAIHSHRESVVKSLDELAKLVGTLGYQVCATVSQRRTGTGSATVLGSGKLSQLALMTGGSGKVTSGAVQRPSKARERREAEESNASGESNEPDDSQEATELPAISGPKPTLVVVDHELTPSQLRNLEKATGVPVVDRTGIIVDIFHRHARSREARLQVEIARLKYLAPRVRESSAPSERQKGSGSGDADVELDRRKIRDRLAGNLCFFDFQR